MMPDKEELDAPGFPELLSTLAAKHASGRLSIFAAATEGALLFNKGKLVDARFGHLTGFQAVNAVAAMPGARYLFDPTADVPTSTSISSSERLVLKQFFGIEAADVHDHPAPVVVDQDDDEATVIATAAPSAGTGTAPRYQRRSRAPYVIAFALSVLIVAVAAVAGILRNRLGQQTAAPASVATTSESTRAPEATATETAQRNASVPDLNGKWNVVNTIHNTSYQSYQNLRIGFALSINQNGTRFTAEGEKVSENGRRLPEGSRTPIHLQGVIDGDRIEATFSEDGAKRRTNGKFVWKLDRAEGALTGTFATSAAKASGKSTAKREL